MQRFISSKCL